MSRDGRSSNRSGCTVVTGATRGLGLEIARRLADETDRDGEVIVCTGRRPSTQLDALIASNEAVRYAELDLADTASIHDRVTAWAREHGPIRALVNNAALAHDGVLATLHPTQIEEMLTVNLLGTILVTKTALRSMLIGRRGRIVNIASIVAHTGFRGLSVYAATKAGLVGFSRSLAREVGQAGVTVNVVAPGFLDTEMSAGLDEKERAKIERRSPLGRLASTSSVAAAVLYLLGPDAGDVTATELVVDAGNTA